DDFARRRVIQRPLERLRDHERRLDDWAERMRRAVQRHHQTASQRLAALAARLETLSPLNVLARGYSLTRPAAGGPLMRDASEVRTGDRLLTTLARGRVVS